MMQKEVEKKTENILERVHGLRKFRFETATVKDMRKVLNEKQHEKLDEILASILVGEKKEMLISEMIAEEGKDVKEYIENVPFNKLIKFMSERDRKEYSYRLRWEQPTPIGTWTLAAYYERQDWNRTWLAPGTGWRGPEVEPAFVRSNRYNIQPVSYTHLTLPTN